MANILKIGNRVLKIGGRILRGDSGSAPVDPYNPLGLPPFTIRCKFTSGYTPTMGDSQTLVDAGENIWDITKNDTNWSSLFMTEEDWEQPWLQSVLGANTTGVEDMTSTFGACINLTSVALFDTSSVFSMEDMFDECFGLTSIPLFDTSNVQNANYMFHSCYSVVSGAFELYQQMSTQANVPSHYKTFTDCGNNENIPDDWKQPDDDGGDDEEEEDYGDDEDYGGDDEE